jgi:phage FluMu gp28-like protein
LAVKSTQIGYSYAAALEAVLDCMTHETVWIVLSRGERQSLEFMQKVRQHVQALKVMDSYMESAFFEQTNELKHELKFPNGSRIIGLPANPDTARGYTGNMILDEFAFHSQDREIWAAAFGRVSRGDLKLRVISTPNGERGKYYELAKDAGLLSAPVSEARPLDSAPGSIWSGHWSDVHKAVAEGCPIDIAIVRAAIADEQTWQQEYECAFLSGRDQYIGLELILACQDADASLSLPRPGERGYRAESAERELYLGYDVARVNDLAVIAVVERVGDVFWTRILQEMPRATFAEQQAELRNIFPLCRRGAIDSTGMGAAVAERVQEEFPGRIEPVTFTAGRKQAMAIRMKRHFEERTLRIPDDRALRGDIAGLKRVITSAGNIRFDAERTADGHADRFWALALALHAAERSGPSGFVAGGIDAEPEWYRTTEMVAN